MEKKSMHQGPICELSIKKKKKNIFVLVYDINLWVAFGSQIEVFGGKKPFDPSLTVRSQEGMIMDRTNILFVLLVRYYEFGSFN